MYEPVAPGLRLVFPDGTELLGKDATDVLARLGRVQWSPMDLPTIKARLSDRAWAWSGGVVDPTQPDDAFLVACEGAGLFILDRMASRAKPAAVYRPD